MEQLSVFLFWFFITAQPAKPLPLRIWLPHSFRGKCKKRHFYSPRQSSRVIFSPDCPPPNPDEPEEKRFHHEHKEAQRKILKPFVFPYVLCGEKSLHKKQECHLESTDAPLTALRSLFSALSSLLSFLFPFPTIRFSFHFQETNASFSNPQSQIPPFVRFFRITNTYSPFSLFTPPSTIRRRVPASRMKFRSTTPKFHVPPSGFEALFLLGRGC